MFHWFQIRGQTLSAKEKWSARTKSGQPYRVFVSHSGDDAWVAEQLAEKIELSGAQAFLDARDIEHGDKFKARIEEKCRNAENSLHYSHPGPGKGAGSNTKLAWPLH